VCRSQTAAALPAFTPLWARVTARSRHRCEEPPDGSHNDRADDSRGRPDPSCGRSPRDESPPTQGLEAEVIQKIAGQSSPSPTGWVGSPAAPGGRFREPRAPHLRRFLLRSDRRRPLTLQTIE
jgi:hypothetical protein